LLLEAEGTAVVTKREPSPVNSSIRPSLMDIRKLVEVIETSGQALLPKTSRILAIPR
jgi:hypothetical protein